VIHRPSSTKKSPTPLHGAGLFAVVAYNFFIEQQNKDMIKD
jgi:hypothetical protein